MLYVVIIGLLLEGVLRLATPWLPGPLQAVSRRVTTGDPFAEAWTPAWQQSREHYYTLRPGLEKQVQYGSPSVRFSLSTVELWEGGGVGFRTDPIDFRVDAVVVGDSFGMCFTERVDCWVDQFATRTNLGVVNLSQPVTGTTSHERILRDFGAPLEPPLVIWQFFGNDFNDDYGLAVFRDEIEPLEDETTTEPVEDAARAWHEYSVALSMMQVLLTGRFSGTPKGEAAFEKPYTVRYGDHVLHFGGAYELQALDMSTPRNQIGLGYSREAFQRAQAMVAEWGGELVIVMIPTREVVYDHLTAPVMGDAAIRQLASARLAMHDLCAELDLRCYDLHDVFSERAERAEALYFADDMHLNPHGNAVLAEALAVWLADDFAEMTLWR